MVSQFGDIGVKTKLGQHTTSHLCDLEVLMAVGRKQMRSAFPPDQPLRRYPTLTRLGLVQRWAVLEIPVGDQLRTEVATKEPALLNPKSIPERDL